MVDMNTMVNLLSTIFLLMLSGYVLTRLKILPASARGPLTDLVIEFILPCNIIVSFLMEFNAEILKSAAVVVAVSGFVQLLSYIVSRYAYPRAEAEASKVLRYSTITSNAGFYGSPIAQGLYGDLGLFYAAFYLIPVRAVMWSVGIVIFSEKKEPHLMRKVLTHPCVASIWVGLVLMVTQVRLPAGLDSALRSVSACNTALSMIVIGSILADIPLNEIFSLQALWYSVVRLLIIPLIVLAFCRLARVDAFVTGISTVLAGMPTPAMTVMMAEKYRSDTHLAVKILFLSTILSLVTIPLLCLIMEMVPA